MKVTQQQVMEYLAFRASKHARPWRHQAWWTPVEVQLAIVLAPIDFHGDVEELVLRMVGLEVLSGKEVLAKIPGHIDER